MRVAEATITLAFGLCVIGLTACGEGETPDEGPRGEAAVEQDERPAGDSDAAEAYRAFLDAAEQGDVEGARTLMAPEPRAQFDEEAAQGDASELLSIMASTFPREITIDDVETRNDTAKLSLHGIIVIPSAGATGARGDTIAGTGVITMIQQNGSWLVLEQEWNF